MRAAMSDEQTDNPNSPEAASNTNISGGVNVDAARDVNIGGDVVGRDKVTHVQNINTDGGAYVGGKVTVDSGSKFVGRDDNSIETGDISAKAVAVGSDAKAGYHEHTRCGLTTRWSRPVLPRMSAVIAAGADHRRLARIRMMRISCHRNLTPLGFSAWMDFQIAPGRCTNRSGTKPISVCCHTNPVSTAPRLIPRPFPDLFHWA
jgi:hypothetical protein